MDLKLLPKADLLAFTDQLSTLDELQMTKEDLILISEFIQSDGCTGVPDFYRSACICHDFRHATHRDFNGSYITRELTDKKFRLHIQHKSKLGKLSPLSWWRWFGVRILGGKLWND